MRHRWEQQILRCAQDDSIVVSADRESSGVEYRSLWSRLGCRCLYASVRTEPRVLTPPLLSGFGWQVGDLPHVPPPLRAGLLKHVKEQFPRKRSLAASFCSHGGEARFVTRQRVGASY